VRRRTASHPVRKTLKLGSVSFQAHVKTDRPIIPYMNAAYSVPLSLWPKGRIPRHRHPRRHPREDRREDVGVGVVGCGLKKTSALNSAQPQSRLRHAGHVPEVDERNVTVAIFRPSRNTLTTVRTYTLFCCLS